MYSIKNCLKIKRPVRATNAAIAWRTPGHRQFAHKLSNCTYFGVQSVTIDILAGPNCLALVRAADGREKQAGLAAAP